MAHETRREFLERTAYTAGMAGLAAALPAGTILAEAADAAARRSGLPSPRNLPIDHFVVLMMENRSFDHYFGWVPGADAVQDQSYTDPSGASVPTRHFSTLGSGGMEYKGCGHPDPGHGWESGRAQLLGGFLADGSGNDEFALTYGPFGGMKQSGFGRELGQEGLEAFQDTKHVHIETKIAPKEWWYPYGPGDPAPPSGAAA